MFTKRSRVNNTKNRMFVIKRSGDHEPVYFDQITTRNEKFCEDLDVDPTLVSKKVIDSIYSGIKTSEIDILSAETALYMSTHKPEYEILAKRIVVSNLHKTTLRDFSKVSQRLFEIGQLDEEYYNFIKDNAEELDKIPQYERDYDFTYFGFKTLEKSYLTKDVNKQILERPQHVWMRVATFLRMPDIPKIKEVYDFLSKKYFIHASPTLYNAGMKCSQLSSCFLLSTNDQLEDMLDCMKYAGLISKYAGGIGVNLSMIRSNGSRIFSTGGKSDGLIPYLKCWNSLARYVNQCFTPDTIVYTTDGPKTIETIQTGNSVITMDGSAKHVNEVICNEVDKDIISFNVTNTFERVSVTPEHDIYAIQGQKKTLNFRVIQNRLNKGIIEPNFIPAKDLDNSSLVGFPIPRLVMDDKESVDFFRLYGIMLGDGYIYNRKDCNSFECGIVVGYKKKDTYEFVTNFLSKRDVHFWTYDDQCRHAIRINWSGTSKVPITYESLYDSQKEKVIAQKYLHLPREKSVSLLKGLFETDGHNDKEIYYYTSSRILAHQIRYILLRYGVLVSGYIKDERGKSHKIREDEYITTKKFNYVIRVPKHRFVSEFIPTVNITGKLKYLEHNGILWSRISDIKYEKYIGKVYDLNIDQNHNYLTNMGIVHNSGRRKGAVAIYLEPHHPDIFEFLKIRKNNTKEEDRCLDLHIALWIPDMFMRRLKENGYWCLFDPNKVKNLHDMYGDEYDQVYLEAEKEKKYEKRIKARELWKEILISQMETGEPYIMFKDHINRKSNQMNRGVIRGSNLCSEVIQYSDHENFAVCNLASISLPAYVEKMDTSRKWVMYSKNGCPYCEKALDLLEDNEEDYTFSEHTSKDDLPENVREKVGDHSTFPMLFMNGEFIGGYTELSNMYPSLHNYTFNFKKLGEITELITENMNIVIDRNFYPVPQTKKSNMEMRPTGIGIQGLADVFQIMDLSWDDQKAIDLNRDIYAVIYYHSLKKSMELSKEHGPYDYFNGSPASKGQLQPDLWGVEPTTVGGLLDWEWLRSEIKQHGLRNSLLITQMPTASSAQILGNNESFEPYTNNMYVRRVLSGDFPVINQHLYIKLKSLGLWTDDLVNELIEKNGSVQNIEGIPQDIKDIFKTAWELSTKCMVDYAIGRGPYIDQTQSFNVFMENPDMGKLSSMFMYEWENGIKTGMYYLRRRPKVDAIKFTIMKDTTTQRISEQEEEHEVCESCSA